MCLKPPLNRTDRKCPWNPASRGKTTVDCNSLMVRGTVKHIRETKVIAQSRKKGG